MRSFPLAAPAVLFLIGSTFASAQTALEDAKLLPADGEEYAEFGSAVAVTGGTAIVGAQWDIDVDGKTGSAYVFDGADGTWQEQAKLLPADGVALDKFGAAVDFDGETVVVGAPFHDQNGTQSGAAYVFLASGGVWTQQAKLLPADGAPGDEFGASVSVHGDTILVGAYHDDDHGDLSGSAYVFVRNGTAWTQQAKLTAPDGSASDGYGYTLSLDGDTAMIGTPWDDDLGLQSGSVYVYGRTGGAWTLRAKLVADDGDDSDQFGRDVSLDGDTAVMGAWADEPHGPFSGSAYVFTRNGDTWSQQAKLLPSDGSMSNLFGIRVAVDENLAVVTAEQAGDRGAAYLFSRVNGSWSQQFKLLSSDGAVADYFGRSVALDDHVVLVGASEDDDNGESSGSAYVFDFTPEDDVPAVGGFGIALTLLLVAGIGIYLLRRPAHHSL